MATARGARALCFEPNTVSTLNVTAYVGVWYEVISDKFVDDTFQRGSACPTATYTPSETKPGYVHVCNSARLERNASNGTRYTIDGYAHQPEPLKYPGRLSVHLNTGFPLPAPYWILATGPIVNGAYQWAVVSDPGCVSLFVLSRKPSLAPATRTAIVTMLLDVGFSMDQIQDEIQGAQCNYVLPCDPSAAARARART
mmetsp:Transcript_30130/g.73399  ORF Transcript_30130/g.73399 Transcript_30130/m.73399 type:complete len:198 (+) Transcript_30130:1201-1794(+)